MLTTVEIDGVLYHATEDGEPLRYRDFWGNCLPDMIKANKCICAARSNYECVCGAWGRDLDD